MENWCYQGDVERDAHEKEQNKQKSLGELQKEYMDRMLYVIDKCRESFVIIDMRGLDGEKTRGCTGTLRYINRALDSCDVYAIINGEQTKSDAMFVSRNRVLAVDDDGVAQLVENLSSRSGCKGVVYLGCNIELAEELKQKHKNFEFVGLTYLIP